MKRDTVTMRRGDAAKIIGSPLLRVPVSPRLHFK